MRGVLIPVLLATTLPAFAGDEPSPDAEPPDTGTPEVVAPTPEALEAEAVRLSAELKRLVQRGAWSGADSTYRALLDTGVPPHAEDHLFGAQAARAIGDIAATRERLVAASAVQPSEQATAELTQIDSLYGTVSLRCDPGSGDLSPAEPPFRADVLAAVAWVQEHLRESCSYDGPLAAGSYTLSGVPFEVSPGTDVVVVDTRKVEAEGGEEPALEGPKPSSPGIP